MSAIGTTMAIPFRWARAALRRLFTVDRMDITCDNVNITIDKLDG